MPRTMRRWERAERVKFCEFCVFRVRQEKWAREFLRFLRSSAWTKNRHEPKICPYVLLYNKLVNSWNTGIWGIVIFTLILGAPIQYFCLKLWRRERAERVKFCVFRAFCVKQNRLRETRKYVLMFFCLKHIWVRWWRRHGMTFLRLLCILCETKIVCARQKYVLMFFCLKHICEGGGDAMVWRLHVCCGFAWVS